MKRITGLACAVLLAAGAAFAEEISNKFALGVEQGIGAGGVDALGRGLSFKFCLSNLVAITGVLGLDFSQKTEDINSPLLPGVIAYKEDKNRVDYTAGLYGTLVLRRFAKVHLNGMTGFLVTYRDNHFDDNVLDDLGANNASFLNSGDNLTKMDIYLRILMAPEVFIFPNFSIEYKYGLDVAIRKDPIPV